MYCVLIFSSRTSYLSIKKKKFENKPLGNQIWLPVLVNRTSAPILSLIKIQDKDKYTLPTLRRRKYEICVDTHITNRYTNILNDSKLYNIVFLLKKVNKSVMLKDNIGISHLVSLDVIILVTKWGKTFYFRPHISVQCLFNDYNRSYNSLTG